MNLTATFTEQVGSCPLRSWGPAPRQEKAANPTKDAANGDTDDDSNMGGRSLDLFRHQVTRETGDNSTKDHSGKKTDDSPGKDADNNIFGLAA